ncbi:methyltransferase-domain-containing protein [Fimicolochytrium jonesii]|uniref:methyltransferase-domain-containing protein n=1 Tax=Fimicolochytrium jonesii TaxID=1396493 RepID=UPI0022FDEA9D|nr:methyltransferase-domain-containing protein [Fimicolochytrium jonesii]KAI8825720.1 methyltransferase-domain-containing protein [Fimicolochytrium jonesii]
MDAKRQKLKARKDLLKKALLKSKQQGDGKPTATASPLPKPVVGATKQNADKQTKEEVHNSKPKKQVKVDVKDQAIGAKALEAQGQKEPKQKLTALQEKMQKKLAGSKFRWINEILYTKDSPAAVQIFTQTPEYFDIYHAGFRSQTESWPTNPVDTFLSHLVTLPAGTVIADMGCGDAKIAQVLNAKRKGQLTTHSFDLVSRRPEVVACDIAHVPLEEGTVDVVVFCLSLMGTNFMDFVREAGRVLKVGGRLMIAEVVSRFPDFEAFVEALQGLGFRMLKKDEKNKMFILFDFVKASDSADADDSHPITATQKTKWKEQEPPFKSSATAASTSAFTAQSKKRKANPQSASAATSEQDQDQQPAVSKRAKQNANKQNAGGKSNVPNKSAPASTTTPMKTTKDGPLLKPCIYKRR